MTDTWAMCESTLSSDSDNATSAADRVILAAAIRTRLPLAAPYFNLHYIEVQQCKSKTS